MMSANSDHDIAIVGIAGRFPGARDLDEFWRNLSQGVESISRLNDDEIVAAGVPEWHLRDPRYVKAAAMLDTAGDFDAGFFGYAPAEAEAMDPQHRLLLELAYEALEHAGCDPGRYAGRVGVFAGAALNTYFGSVGLHERLAEDYIPTLIGNDKDFLSTRISYKLNLTGPSLTVQSACSTSMVAVHLARQSLLSRETDMVLAGAVSVRVPHRAGYFCHRGGVTSPDGHVRAFDARANGTVFGSGGGVLVLKRLADAVADGDAIHAVIKGSAVNNDGATKAGYTAPSVLRQAEVVVEALGNAGVDADTIGYVEAHASGTSVGDPIEVAALTRAFRRFTARSGFCAIGSVKTNVGHLDAAAGIAGLIKTVLALKNGRLPASLNYVEPNPEIDFEHTPFFVNTRLRDWPHDGPRRAGVMATGMGGTNAHVVLEQAPAPATPHDTRGPHVLVLSAKTAHALDQATERLAAFLDAPAAPRMDDVAHTLQAGRQGFAHRRALVCGAREDAMQGLRDARRMTSGTAPSQRRPVMLLLPGVGDQYVGMGRELYESWPVFAEAVDQCAAILEPHIGVDIRSVLYPPGRERARHEHSARIDLRKMLARDAGAPPDPDTARLNETRFAQPALFTIEYATWRVWQSLGVKPDAIVGHSMGEYVAAVIAGILSLEDALHLVAVRARLANDLPAGAMLAVTLSELELAPLLPDALSVALVNGPHLCVVAGPTDAVAEFEAALTTRLVICRRVRNAHAFHSPLLDPITESFEREVRGVRLHPPAIPCMSNVSGTWITAGEATSAAYWTAHAVRTARFGDALDAVWRFDDPILLEAGPGRTLGVLAMQHPARRARGGEATVIASLPHDYERGADVELLARAIGKLWVAGVEIDWGALPAHGRFKTPLPTYPFERTRHWRAPVPAGNTRPPSAARATPRNPPDQWLYAPSWKRTMSPRVAPSVGAAAGECETWVVFADDTGLSSRLVKRLSGRGHRVITVRPGARFHRVDRNTFAIAAGDAGDYDLLLRTMRESGARPSRIVHAWGVCDRRPSESDDQQLDGALERGI